MRRGMKEPGVASDKQLSTVTEQALLARLLIPGWAGLLTIIEAEYIASQLAVDAKLRRAWGYRRQKKYTLQSIAEKANSQDPDEGRRIMENHLAQRNRRCIIDVAASDRLALSEG